MNIPDTRAFDNCLDAINKFSALDNSELSNQLIIDSKFDQLYLEPCRREFRKNLMHLDEQGQNKLIIFCIKELLGTVDKAYVKNRRNTKFDYEDSGFNEKMTLDEYLTREAKAYEHSDLIATYQFYVFLDFWGICREYNIQLEEYLVDLKIDFHDYFPSYVDRLFKGNMELPKPEMPEIVIRSDERTFEEFTETQKDQPPQQKKYMPSKPSPNIKPPFKAEAIQDIYTILKDFFSFEQQAQLLQLLNSGNNTGEKLIFLNNGNRLTDMFKKLYQHNYTTMSSKKVLQKWICQTFMFLQRNVAKPYNIETVERIISGNQSPCKNPLIQIINGQIVKDPNPRQNKISNH